MYPVAEVLQRIDQHLGVILLFTLIAWITGFVQIVEALRLGRRDRVPGVPIGMTAFLLAHDSSFFLRYDYWFHSLGHWYFEVFWVGMGIAVLIELAMVAQFLRHGRRLLAPQLSATAFFSAYLLMQLCAFALLFWLKSLLDDPLQLVPLALTQVAAVIFNVPFLLVRGNARGQSRLYAWATLLGPGSLALGLFPALSPVFQTFWFAVVGVLLVALSLCYLLLLEHYRRLDAAVRPA